MEDIAIMLGYTSLRNTTEAVTTFERDKMVKVVRRRRLSTSAHMTFQPIFDAFERTGSRQFMKTLTFSDELTITEMAQVPDSTVNNHVMCIKVSRIVYATVQCSSTAQNTVHYSSFCTCGFCAPYNPDTLS